MDDSWGPAQLSPEVEALFWRIWNWLTDKKITDKPSPQVFGSDGCSAHAEGMIYINQKHQNVSFPLPAVILEEQLHYILSSDDPSTSADFAPLFLHRILDIILTERNSQTYEQKREFQSVLIGQLWKLVESGIRPQTASHASDTGGASQKAE